MVLKYLKPAYEGWKLKNCSIDKKTPLSHLKPAYEGWKQASKGMDGSADIHLKPAYEGWKQRSLFETLQKWDKFKACL